ncbi:MAG: cysteine--tRNA ligase, partial [Desulfobulbaceae bacterium]|nr:cysteine--tRNA ligase [Desulfobulbaceae bacterium]
GEKPVEPAKPVEVRFFNSLKRRKEPFRSQRADKVTFYACGPTAHEIANLGHCRRFVVADLITRLLSDRGYKVEYYMNFTDLDDNTIAGAEAAGKSLTEFTEGYIHEFMADINALGVLPATSYPRASQHVEQMIELAKELTNKGYAYEKHGSIYFDISKFPRYGKLAQVDLGKIKVGKTVDLDNYDKDSPVDFTLLKRSTLAELKNGIFYKSQWGNIRPGWHIECAAMSLHLFGQTMDIHTSSRDLIFPHHENENAIAEAVTGKPLANYWLHSELLTVDGKKMSREQENIVTLRDVVAKGYTPRQLRFFLIASHYRKPINFTYKRLDESCRSLKRLDDFIRKLICLPPELPHPEIASHLTRMEEGFAAAMNDDLNISRGLGCLFDFIKKANPIIAAGMLDRDQKQYIIEALSKINAILNVMRLEQNQLAPEIDKLLQEREQARRDKDWARADAVRAQLAGHGITVLDTGKGPVWKEQPRRKK